MMLLRHFPSRKVAVEVVCSVPTVLFLPEELYVHLHSAYIVLAG